jgi:hypothetical protein
VTDPCPVNLAHFIINNVGPDEYSSKPSSARLCRKLGWVRRNVYLTDNTAFHREFSNFPLEGDIVFIFILYFLLF